MKIYTKTGDRGETGLLGGVRVRKSHIAIHCVGDVDETNCLIGMAISLSRNPSQLPELVKIQEELFVIGSQIANCQSGEQSQFGVGAESVSRLERQIDERSDSLPTLDAFILPGGSPCGAQLHVARTVCRRAERRLIDLIDFLATESDLPTAAIYLNRLSDLLFVLARAVNVADQMPETKWLPE